MDEHDQPYREARPKVAVISVMQAQSFLTLRRAQTESDRLPVSHAKTFEGGRIGRCGLNGGLARRAVTTLGEVWVVPGSGYVALVAGGVVCNRTEVAARKGMVTWTSDSTALQDLVHGLVPDGVGEVCLNATNDAWTTVAVNDNVYGTVLEGHLRSVRFVGPGGTVDLGPWG
jgi:hypothetical protein